MQNIYNTDTVTHKQDNDNSEKRNLMRSAKKKNINSNNRKINTYLRIWV